MEIKDILAKVAKAEELTADEKKFVVSYDPQKVADDAAAAARRKESEASKKGQTEIDDLKAKLKVAEDEKKAIEDAKKAGATEAEKMAADMKALRDSVETLTKGKADAEAKATATARSQTIRDAAKAAGIILAPKTVSEKMFHGILEGTLSGVDIADKEALKTALEGFKSENLGVIAAPGAGSGVDNGEPDGAKGSNGKAVIEQSDDERVKDLKKSGIL